jgi:hypothetical protein
MSNGSELAHLFRDLKAPAAARAMPKLRPTASAQTSGAMRSSPRPRRAGQMPARPTKQVSVLPTACRWSSRSCALSEFIQRVRSASGVNAAMVLTCSAPMVGGWRRVEPVGARCRFGGV